MLKKKLINLRVAVFVALSLVLGILSACFYKFDNATLSVLTTLCFLAFLIVFFFIFFKEHNIKTICIFVVLFVLFFVLGLGSFLGQTSRYEDANLNNHYFTVDAKVEKAETTDTGSALLLTNIKVKGVVNAELKYKMMLYVYGENTIDIGDKVHFDALIKDKSLTYENSFSSYDLANKIKYTASINASEINITSKDLSVFEYCNLFIKNTLKSGLDYQEFTVAYGMLAGDSELMDYNVINAYRYLGVAHVFAVSGLHIGFLALALNFLFDKLKVKRLAKAIIITAVLFFYSGICGFTASSLRATIMSAVMLFLSAKGERYDGLSAVSIAGIILLLISPVQLFCVGFQLSFVVVIGILLLSKPIERLLVKRVKILPKKVCSSIGVVVSAQLSGIPILLKSFGYFSPISIIANFILIPIIGVIFYLLFIFTILGGIFSIPKITLFIPNYALKLINFLILAIDSEKLLIGGVTIGVFAIVYYIALIIPSGLVNLKIKTKIISTVIAIVIFIGGATAINLAEYNKTSVYVCGSSTASITIVSTKNENVLIISDIEKIFSLANLRRLSYKNSINDIDSVIIGGGFDYDMQVCISRLIQVFNLKNVYYYGQKDVMLETVMNKSFAKINVRSFYENQSLPLSNIHATYLKDGLAVDLTINNKRVVTLSTPDEFNGYERLCGDIDILISGQSIEQLDNRLKPKKIVSFREVNGFDDGESNGNYCYSFK